MTATAFAPADLEPHTLYDDLVLLPHNEPFARRNGRSANCYAVVREDHSVLVDGGFSDLLAAADALQSKGTPPKTILLTHRHVAAQGDAFDIFIREFGATIFLHPLDAHHPQARRTGLAFADPMTSELLRSSDIEILFFPGHTEGHIMVYLAAHGGVLLTGDCAMGPRFDGDVYGTRLVRPPINLMVDDAQLRHGWETFKRPLATVGPYHGGLFVDQGDAMGEVMAPLTRLEPTWEL